jgi:hypothetical protein
MSRIVSDELPESINKELRVETNLRQACTGQYQLVLLGD